MAERGSPPVETDPRGPRCPLCDDPELRTERRWTRRDWYCRACRRSWTRDVAGSVVETTVEEEH